LVNFGDIAHVPPLEISERRREGMMHITTDQSRFINGTTTAFLNDYNARFAALVRHDLRIERLPDDLNAFVEKVGQVGNYASWDHDVDIPRAVWPALKRVLLSERRRMAREIEKAKAKTPHPQILASLEELLEPYTSLLAFDAMQNTEALASPRLTDYLTLERVVELTKEDLVWQPRVFDEKFHILTAPELFLPDLEYHRRQADLRGLSVGVVFLDIDNFKLSFNKPYGEFIVDRFVLPRFMEALEAHFYGHGQAYRFGGDEYAVIMPNADQEIGLLLLDRFRARLRELTFQNVEPRITVSAGLCVASGDCHLTNPELLERATKAKNVAKDKGKNRVAGFRGELFRDSDIEVLSESRQGQQ
jgi:diguanylate cyclase (GGDEF)-like protein